MNVASGAKMTKVSEKEMSETTSFDRKVVPLGLNARKVIAKRYSLKDAKANSLEEWSDIVARVVAHVSVAETDPAQRDLFFNAMSGIMQAREFVPNTPCLVNAGKPNGQLAACFVLDVPDSIAGIMKTATDAAIIHQTGGGTGFTFEKLRPSGAMVRSTHGVASGPVSFMRGADASAGTIKSGGKTRRAAKMVVLDVDHPDITEFIWCKAHEEEKARVLEAAGYDMSLDSPDWSSIQYQNANNSVRVTDAFMEAIESDGGSCRMEFLPYYVGAAGVRCRSACRAHNIAGGSLGLHSPVVGGGRRSRRRRNDEPCRRAVHAALRPGHARLEQARDPSPHARAIRDVFGPEQFLQPRLVVQHALLEPGRAENEQDQGEPRPERERESCHENQVPEIHRIARVAIRSLRQDAFGGPVHAGAAAATKNANTPNISRMIAPKLLARLQSPKASQLANQFAVRPARTGNSCRTRGSGSRPADRSYL
jgi:hypothetical protein